MKLLAPLLTVLLLGAASPAPPTAAAPRTAYFGSAKLSASRIGSSIQHLQLRYQTHTVAPQDALPLATSSEDAFYRWAAAYPRDSRLGQTGYNLGKLFETLPGSGARAGASRAFAFVRTHCRHTRYADLSAAELARGIPEVPLPDWTANPGSPPAP